ncbi:MAG: LLM class flavin-dependent oxidoreductase [Chloroflexota bacterium]|nr:LLM class flavin-dependent oxidoreductase [Chloroflexota bacterium]
MKRGFGVSALIASDFVGPLAQQAEASGYATFWVNDVPGGNGLAQLGRAQQATSRIRLGVGVLPVDRWTAEEIAAVIAAQGLDESRLLLGIGAGALQTGSVEATRAFAEDLRGVTTASILVGALGPRMVRMAGEATDGVLLNWLTPVAASESADIIRSAAGEAGRAIEVIAYVRTAASPQAAERLASESAAYEGYPSYKRHFDRMGVRAIDTTVNGGSSEISARYALYTGVDEIVCRAIVSEETLDAYSDVLAAAAPDDSPW